MTRVSFPQNHREQVADSDHAIYFEKIGAEADHATVLHELISQFSEDDFRTALLDPRIPERYKNVHHAAERVTALSRSSQGSKPIGAYLLSLETNQTDLQPIGLVVHGNIKGDQRRLRPDTKKRNTASWFAADVLEEHQVPAPKVAEAIVLGGITVAKTAGLQRLLAVKPVVPPLNPHLIVPENLVDLQAHGFRDIGEVVLKQEKMSYPGLGYELSLEGEEG